MKLIPEIERCGFDGNFHKLTPFDLFQFILTESKAETLLKSGQTPLLKHFAYKSRHHINDYWASIRICIRNDYKVEDASVWCDYVDLLRDFEKDLHNSKYVCPKNLYAEHDKYMQKRRIQIEREREIEDRQKALDNEAIFQEQKSKFFGISFSDGLIQIRVLESVEEIMQEGDTLHHCVFTNNYYLKPDSLILSACIEGQRLETIELSLSKLDIVQSRGLQNQTTEYHERIINLVRENISLIKKQIAA